MEFQLIKVHKEMFFTVMPSPSRMTSEARVLTEKPSTGKTLQYQKVIVLA